ncbi:MULTISPECIES: amidohydrolase family protein [Streptomyces violaceusniger group]|nr:MULTISPECIES: amidohydrolase family protein [Streptomyces violaceusniger group]
MDHLVVDVHAHLWAAEVETMARTLPGHAERIALDLRRLGPLSAKTAADRFVNELPLLVDVNRRLAAMTAAGVDVQVVSVTPTQYHHWITDPGAARDLARLTHEAVAGHCVRRSGRLTGLGVVPQQFPEWTVEALDDALTRGLRGVEIATHAPDPCGGPPIELSDRRYDDLWARAAERGAVIFVHPGGCTLDERLAHWYLANSVGQLVEHAVALSHLIVGGVLERFPGLTVLAAHGGGHLPAMTSRADHAWHARREARTTQLPPSEYLSRLYVDSLVYEPAALRRLVDALGTERVLLGSDFPFDMGVPDPAERLRAVGLDVVATAAIAGGTAARIGLVPASASQSDR